MNINDIKNFRFKGKDTVEEKCDSLLKLIKDITLRYVGLAKDFVTVQVRLKTLEGKLVQLMENNLEMIKLMERTLTRLDEKAGVESDDNGSAETEALEGTDDTQK